MRTEGGRTCCLHSGSLAGPLGLRCCYQDIRVPVPCPLCPTWGGTSLHLCVQALRWAEGALASRGVVFHFVPGPVHISGSGDPGSGSVSGWLTCTALFGIFDTWILHAAGLLHSWEGAHSVQRFSTWVPASASGRGFGGRARAAIAITWFSYNSSV